MHAAQAIEIGGDERLLALIRRYFAAGEIGAVPFAK
jgi:hypothetical protein